MDAAQTTRQTACIGVVFGQPVHMVVQRVQRTGRQQPSLAQPAAGHLADAARAIDQFARTTQCRADRRTQAFAEADGEAVEMVGDLPHTVVGTLPGCGRSHGRVEHPRAVQVRGQTMTASERRGVPQVVIRHHMAVPGVLQAQQPGAGEVRVVGLDGRRDVGQHHAALGVLRQRLRLHAAEHRRTTAFVAVGVGQLADDVLVAPAAVRQDAAQVALRARRHEQRRLFARERGDALLQRVDRGIVAEHIVAQGRSHHGGTHGRRRLRDGVASEVNGLHAACSRKFFNIAWPCSVRMLSGWNCTPSMASVLCFTPMISPSGVQAVTFRQSGQLSR